MVLLELITGQPAIIKTDETVHIIQWVSSELEQGDIKSIVDHRLQENFDVNSVCKALEVAMACTTSHSQQRATMSYVLLELKQCLEIALSKDIERAPIRQAHNFHFHSYSSTLELSSIYTDSVNMDSVTTPLAR